MSLTNGNPIKELKVSGWPSGVFKEVTIFYPLIHSSLTAYSFIYCVVCYIRVRDGPSLYSHSVL
jgi:hypothetical protein